MSDVTVQVEAPNRPILPEFGQRRSTDTQKGAQWSTPVAAVILLAYIASCAFSDVDVAQSVIPDEPTPDAGVCLAPSLEVEPQGPVQLAGWRHESKVKRRAIPRRQQQRRTVRSHVRSSWRAAKAAECKSLCRR